MNKTAIKNFAIWARNKLIADIKYKAGLMGITEQGIAGALPQSAGGTEFYDIGTSEPYCISGKEIEQRRRLKEVIENKAADTDYSTAYKYVIEEVAYTWFNRLIAVRFMEVNDYLPGHIRVLSSETGKMEPDLVTTPFDAELVFASTEEERIIQLKQDNKIDELFRMLFIKQCNALNELLPALFEKTNDYTEILLNLSVIDQEGVVYHLVHDIPEEDFDVNRGGQVEIIGWLYQYYNTEPKNDAFAKKGKITKEEIPAVTQLFTPDWIVRYMVENSLGRLWLEGHPDDTLKANWKYYLDEVEQEPEVQSQLDKIKKEHAKLNPDDIKLIDPCMGSGHILVYAFDVFMQIYESAGWSQRDAAKSIIENNIYGLDIDDRAFQMAYFAVMMKARQYNRRILYQKVRSNLYAIRESNDLNRNHLDYFGFGLDVKEKELAKKQICGLLDTFQDAKEFGSLLKIENRDWDLLRHYVKNSNEEQQISFASVGLEETKSFLLELIDIASEMCQKYHIFITNPPYLNSGSMPTKLGNFIKKQYPKSKTDLYAVFTEKALEWIQKDCFLGMITQQAWMFLNYFEELRKLVFNYDIVNMAHLGARAFAEIGGEVVQTTTFVICKTNNPEYLAKYVRLTKYDSEECKEKEFMNPCNYFTAKKEKFYCLPGFSLAYWISDETVNIFENEPQLKNFAEPRAGLQTGENESFLRLWPEVNYSTLGFGCKNAEDCIISKKKWFPYSKGGSFRRWYGNYDYVVNWYNDGEDIKRDKLEKLDAGIILPSNSKPKNVQYYFRSGVTWSTLSSAAFAARWHIEGSIFDIKGSTCFFENEREQKYVMGLMNSKPFNMMLQVISPTLDFNAGYIGKVPVKFSEEYFDEVVCLVEKAISLAKEDWNMFENSWDFERHPLIHKNSKIENAFNNWQDSCERRFNGLKMVEERLNRIFIDIYGLEGELDERVEDKDISIHKADYKRDIKSLLSYAVGCILGRYSLDSDGIMCTSHRMDKALYESFVPDEDAIIPITDEEYLEDDIVARLCTWLKIVYGDENLEENLDYISKALAGKGNSSRDIIRSYFLNSFFKDHCNIYSVTGSGKRPIYWLFDSGKQNGFKALIYLHRYTPDTIGNLRVDYLHRMQRVYESEMNRMQDMIEHSTNSREVAAASKRKEKLQKQLKECREYDEKISHLALDRIELDLDDGVKYNYRKIQTGSDGKFYEVLADSKSIMMDAKKYADFKK